MIINNSSQLSERVIKQFPYYVSMYEKTEDRLFNNINDIFIWCENSIGKYTQDWHYDIVTIPPDELYNKVSTSLGDTNIVFLFKRENDAVYFKITWG